MPDHVFGHGRFGDIVAQQKQFGLDSGCAPRWVFAGHASNQVTDLAFDARANGFSGPGFPPPIQFESHSLPFDNCLGLHNGQSGSPVRPQAGDHIQKMRSRVRSSGRLMDHLKTATCCRSARFSAAAARPMMNARTKKKVGWTMPIVCRSRSS